MKVQGNCHCGAVAFEADVDPQRVTLCHCTDCQILSGSAFRTTVPAPVETFVLKTGAPKIYVKTTAESGHPRIQAFCGNCGTPLYGCAAENAVTYGLRVGALAQRDQLRPTRQIWRRSALDWVGDVERLPGREKE